MTVAPSSGRPNLSSRSRSTTLDDLYIMGQAPDDLDVVAAPFADNPLVVLAPAGHPVRREEDCALAARARTIHSARAGLGDPPGDRALFRRAQDPPGDPHDARSDETIKQAVAAGLGLAVLSRHVVTLDPPQGPLRELDVEGCPISRRWYVVYLTDKRLSPLARAFLTLLKESRR